MLGVIVNIQFATTHLKDTEDAEEGAKTERVGPCGTLLFGSNRHSDGNTPAVLMQHNAVGKLFLDLEGKMDGPKYSQNFIFIFLLDRDSKHTARATMTKHRSDFLFPNRKYYHPYVPMFSSYL